MKNKNIFKAVTDKFGNLYKKFLRSGFINEAMSKITNGEFVEGIKRKAEKFKKILEKISPEISNLISTLNSKNTTLAKILALAGLIYLVSPIDFIPDTIPVIGFLDDIMIIVSIFNSIKNGKVAEDIRNDKQKG